MSRTAGSRSGFWAVVAAVIVGAVAAGNARPAATQENSERTPATQRLVLGLYHYSYQGDRRKEGLPVRDIRDSKGVSTLADHPWESVGPWMSYDRAQWHKAQFQLMAGGGLDVALAVYRGDKASRETYSVKGLDVMVEALKELRAEGQGNFQKPREYPMLGMALDLDGLQDLYGAPVDLRQGDVQKSLYGMVRDFFTHVPEEFRATVQLPSNRPPDPSSSQPVGGSSPLGAAYIVRLIGDDAVKAADATTLVAVNKRFAEEFGARLIWIATPRLQKLMKNVDGVAAYPAGAQRATIGESGWLRTGSFGPGYDSSAAGGQDLRPRDNGLRVLEDFRAIMASGADWTFIDSWNGYTNGTEIAPTLEHGLVYRDLIRGGILQYKKSADYAVTFLRASMPKVLQQGQIYQVDVLLQNSGTNEWTPQSPVSLTYRWLKDGKPAGEQGTIAKDTGQVQGNVVPITELDNGDTKSHTLGVVGPLEMGKPLAAGSYEIEFFLTYRDGLESTRFEEEGSAPFRIPVQVGDAPAGRAAWVYSTMSPLAQRGAVYPTKIRVRNDGSDTWKKAAVSVVYRWRKVAPYLKGASEEMNTIVAEGKATPLPIDLTPGRAAEVDVDVAVTDASGQPLAAWTPKDPWSYVLEWDLVANGKPLSAGGAATYREVVEVVERDPGASFIGCNLATELVGGKQEKITVGLRNLGPNAWKKDRDKVVVHWYYMDGTEASWIDDSLPLQDDVPAFSRELIVRTGDKADPEKKKKRDKKDKEEEPKRPEYQTRDVVLREVPVRIPYYFGPMYCVLDFQYDGAVASIGSSSKGNDTLVIPINVFSPTFTPIPLVPYFNTDGISQDSDRRNGDLDGRGNTLPAEYLPPYVNRPYRTGALEPAGSMVYPSGLWSRPLNDLEASRAGFLFPSKANDAPNMLFCDGQKIPFTGLSRTAVHLMALCTEEDVTATFTLIYADGTNEAKKITLTHWNDKPKHGERVAFSTAHRHTQAGDDPNTRCYINHYKLETDRLKQLIGIELPNERAIKVMGLTLEQGTLKPN